MAAALVGYFTSASWWVILLFAAVYFGLVNVKLELPVKLSWLWAAILLVIGAILSVFSVQYVLLTDEDFVKTTDMVCVVNMVLALAIYLVILFYHKQHEADMYHSINCHTRVWIYRLFCL